MSTALAPTPTSAPAREQHAAAHRVTQGRVIVSEWVKFRSLRSSWVTLAVAVVAMIGLGAAFSAVTNSHWGEASPSGGPPAAGTTSAFAVSLGGVTLAQLAIAVLGVLLISGEYSTGMIRASLSAVPSRLPVLWAKVVVFASIVIVATLIGAFGAFFLGQALLGTHATTIGAAHVVRALIGVAVYLTLVGVMALGIGGILRNTAGGIATVVGLLLILPGLGQLLPSSWQSDILPYLPSNAGASMYAVTTSSGSLSPWAGFAVLCAWAAAAVIGAAFALKRRDA